MPSATGFVDLMDRFRNSQAICCAGPSKLSEISVGDILNILMWFIWASLTAVAMEVARPAAHGARFDLAHYS